MTSHNEALIPCLGPLATSSLGPHGNQEESQSTDPNSSINSLSSPSLSGPAPLPWVRDTESLSKGPCQRGGGPAEAGTTLLSQKAPTVHPGKGDWEAIWMQLMFHLKQTCSSHFGRIAPSRLDNSPTRYVSPAHLASEDSQDLASVPCPRWQYVIVGGEG